MSFMWEAKEIQDMDTDELLEEFKQSVEELPGTGARGRSRYYAALEELRKRVKKGIDN